MIFLSAHIYRNIGDDQKKPRKHQQNTGDKRHHIFLENIQNNAARTSYAKAIDSAPRVRVGGGKPYLYFLAELFGGDVNAVPARSGCVRVENALAEFGRVYLFPVDIDAVKDVFSSEKERFSRFFIGRQGIEYAYFLVLGYLIYLAERLFVQFRAVGGMPALRKRSGLFVFRISQRLGLGLCRDKYYDK